MPAKYSQAAQSANPAGAGGGAPNSTPAAAAVPWWKTLGDPELERLVQAALVGSFDVQAAFARVQQARALADMAGAPRLPSLDMGLGATVRSFNPANFGARGGEPVTVYGFTGSLSAAYEVDMWAKVASGARAAALDAVAAQERSQSVAMTVAAEVAGAYFDLVAARAQRALVAQQKSLSEAFLQVLELRFAEGLATTVELDQQRQQVIAASAALDQLLATETVSGHRLATLLGMAPGELALPRLDALPTVPPLPATGLPSELLQRRPDLRAAQRRVEAADYRVAVAVADRYPSLRLTGSLTSQPSKLNDFLLQPVWELASSLAMPIFDNGRRSAEVDRQRAVMAEAVAEYGKAVLGGLVEVENALVQERQQQLRIGHVQQQLLVAQRTLQQAQLRYSQGAGDYLSVLTALRSQQEVERSLLDAQHLVLTHRISLYRALGGTWAQSLVPHSARAEESS